MLGERLADLHALREQEGVGHAAADDQRVDLVEQVAEQVELGRDLGAADDRATGRAGASSALVSASSSACMARPA